MKQFDVFDKIILFFLALFLASLTNSIFINQLGYYGAVFFLLIKWYKTKEHPFPKTGLELAFLLFLCAEFISSLLSYESAHSFNNLLKRLLLIPIVYVLSGLRYDARIVKIIFYTYLFFALTSCTIYLGYSIDFYLRGNLIREQSGPSVFQYPITAGEIISFTTVFLFAFLLEERGTWQYKLLIFFVLLLSGAALVATYKRTGWIGAGIGMFIVLLFSRKRKLSFILPVIFVFLTISQKNINELHIWSFQDNKYIRTAIITAEGRANHVTPHREGFLLSDFGAGIVSFNSAAKEVSRVKFESPVYYTRQLRDSLYAAYLQDSRIIFFTINKNIIETLPGEYCSPGFTIDWEYINDYLYICDKDSGLTIFKPVKNINSVFRYPIVKGYEYFGGDSLYLCFFAQGRGIDVFSTNNLKPVKNINTENLTGKVSSCRYEGKTILLFTEKGIYRFDITSGRLTKLKSGEIAGEIIQYSRYGNTFTLLTSTGSLFTGSSTSDSVMEIKTGTDPILPVFSAVKSEQFLFLTHNKESRLLSIFDPQSVSNASRIALWRAGWKIFLDHPLFGVGDIDLAKLFRQYKRPYDKEIQGHMHNNYVHILVILGAVGFLIFCFLMIKIGAVFISNYREQKDIPFAGSFQLGAIGVFASFLASGLTEWNFGDHEIITMLWFVLGMSLLIKKKFSTNNP